MTKLILQAGEIIDVITQDYTQWFCVVDGETTLASTIYLGDELLQNFRIERLEVDSTMIVSIETAESLTDENGNFYECVKFANILTENNLKPFI
jgi:hypothetical protein